MLHRDHHDRLVETHKSFYCPIGHSQSFVGKTKQEKEIESLERQLAQAKKNADRCCEHWDLEHETRTTLVRAIQICPLGCGHVGNRRMPYRPEQTEISRFFDRVFGDITEHLQEAHRAEIKTTARAT